MYWRYLARSRHWRWPAVWSITDTMRRSGLATCRSKCSRTSAVATSQRRCSRCSALSTPSSRHCCRVSMAVSCMRCRTPPRSRLPTITASSTVVMPAAAHCASCTTVAEYGSHNTPGRGSMCFSRLSVCTSTRPGSSRSPSRSIACGSMLRPGPMSAMTPSRTSTCPRKHSLAVTTWALLNNRSGMGRAPAGWGRRGPEFKRAG